MSIMSFLKNCRHDPNYPFRRARWKILQGLPERNLSRNTDLGFMTFSSKDQIIGRAIYLTGQFAFSEVEKVCNFLVDRKFLKEKNNSLLFDIGANIGTICIPLLRLNIFETVHAFEPEPKNLKFLRKNRSSNGLEQKLCIHDIGLSSKDTTMFLEKSETNFGDHRILKGRTPSNKETVSVKVKRLDQFLQENQISPQDISLIWMDTQGHEADILEASKSVLEAGVPLVMEYWPFGLKVAEANLEQMLERLSSYYEIFLDLRDPEFKERSTRELKFWVKRYDFSEDSYTDLLFVRGQTA